MEAKLFRWVAQHRRAVIASSVLVVVGSAIALPIFRHQAARDRELHKGDSMVQSLPIPADGSLQSVSSQQKDGWFNQAFADSVIAKDTWHATYGTRAAGSLPEIGATYRAQLMQAGWGRDTACLAKGTDSFGRDGLGWYSACWVKDGFSLSLSYLDARQEYGYVWIDVSMTEIPPTSHPTT